MKYSSKRRKPDLMTVLILVVALGLVVTLSTQAKVNDKGMTQVAGPVSSVLVGP